LGALNVTCSLPARSAIEDELRDLIAAVRA
jgi:hypothetical protein